MRIQSIVALSMMVTLTTQNNTVILPITVNRWYVLSCAAFATSFALYLSKRTITIADANFEKLICTERNVTNDIVYNIAGLGILLLAHGAKIDINEKISAIWRCLRI